MPKKPKISPAKRREWLERHERGERQDEIAGKDKVNPRTVRDQIERARLERAFEAAQRDQLGEALRSHQQDMLKLLEQTKNALEMPRLEFESTPFSPPLGLEDLVAAPEFAKMEGVNLNAQGLKLIRHRDGPLEIRLPEEDSQLWRALKEHLGNKDPVWRNIANWRRALLEELQAQAALNRAIKAQGIFGLLVFAPSSDHPYSITSLVNLVRVEVITRALGEPPTSAFSSARVAQWKP